MDMDADRLAVAMSYALPSFPTQPLSQIDVIFQVVVHGEMGAERRPWSFLV
jgi:hypothetical protein